VTSLSPPFLGREIAAKDPFDRVQWVHDLIEEIQRSTPRTRGNEEAFGALKAAKNALSVFLALAADNTEQAVFEGGAVINALSMLLADKGSIGNPMAEALHVYRTRTGY
jgi:hypothetical protein